MKKYELTYRTIIETTKKHVQSTNEATNELIHKIKLALIGNDESAIDDYDINIEFYDYGDIDLSTMLSLIYDDVIIKRSNLFDHVKSTYDSVYITFRSDKMKYSEDDPVDHHVTVNISLEYDSLDYELYEYLKKEYLFNICAYTLDEKPLIFVYVKKKNN